MKRFWLIVLASTALVWVGRASAADWPQFRYDAGRTAASPESLAADLHLQWVRRLPEPRPAFPIEVRLRLDASYEPVVMGKTMFVPSMVTDSVTALDTETGAQRWCFFADGPVRFAPVAWQGKVFFVSDDGYAYCLKAADGELLWKFRGLPADRNDRKLLGNGRLISLWPARGGPVLADGVLYFAAGLWPSEGAFVYALDAGTGEVVWSNADSNRIDQANMDHGIAQVAGLTPQGYLAVVNEELVVPCGAQLPAVLDLKTGALDTYQMGWGGRVGLPKGSWFVAGVGCYLSHCGDLYNMDRTNDESFGDPRVQNDFKSQLYPGRFTRLRIEPKNQKGIVGPFRQPVLTARAMYDNDEGIVAYDLTQVDLQERRPSEAPPPRQEDKYPDKWQGDFRELWRLASKLKVHILAGRHLYAGGPGQVQAVRVPTEGEDPQVVWKEGLDGTPHSMLAADGKLFVITEEGHIYAFGPQAKAEPARHAVAEDEPQEADRWSQRAKTLLESTGADQGYALVLGLKTGRLVEELVRRSQLYVIAVDRDAERVDSLRNRLHRAGLYGARATVHQGDPLGYPFPPYLANLVATEDLAALAPAVNQEVLEAVFRPLRPYGGAACLPIPAEGRDSLRRELAAAELAGSTIRQTEDLVLLARGGRLPGSADWSHPEADAAGTGASADVALKPPLKLLWFDASKRWHRKPGSSLVCVAGGRIFAKAETLLAIDVYTGRRLWQRTLRTPHTPADQMVAMEDAVYVTGGRTCLVLDPATGRTRSQITLPDELTGPWTELRVWEDYLVGQSGRYVICVDRLSGQVAWKRQLGRSALSLAVGGGKLFCAELVAPQRGETQGDDTKTRAFDLKTGQLVWEVASGSSVRYSPSLDLLVTASGIYRAGDGSLAWRLPAIPPPDPSAPKQPLPEPLFIIGDRLLRGTPDRFSVFDLRSGDRVGDRMEWVRRGCTGLRASANLVTTRYRANSAYIDLDSHTITSLWNVRPGCYNSLFPANGILNVPDITGGCECNYTPTSQAYVPASAIE